jgi:hypothetical protein
MSLSPDGPLLSADTAWAAEGQTMTFSLWLAEAMEDPLR